MKKFHQYLSGLKFTIKTDHKPLLGIFGEAKPIPTLSAARIQRWALLLSGYNYTLEYKRGEDNANADGMSRLPVDNKGEVSQATNDIFMLSLDRAPVNASEIKSATSRCPILSRVVQFTQHGWPEDMEVKQEYKPFQRIAVELTVEDGCLLWGGRSVIPEILRVKVMEELHQAHVGMTRMKMLARGFCWWPSMDAEIEEMVASCDKCTNHVNNPAKAIVHPWEIVCRPWSRIHIDHAGPFLNKMFLIIVDSYSKWVECHIVNTATSNSTCDKLRCSFATMGLPDVIVSDNATAFTSEELSQFMKKNSIRHVTSAPYHPSTNGAAERTVQDFKRTLKKLSGSSKVSLESQVARFLYTQHNTPSTVTGLSPAEILFKKKPKTRLDLMRPDVETSLHVATDKMIRNSGKNPIRCFEAGEKVIARS